MDKTRPSDRKAWARSTFRGVENLLLPSFGPDLTTLDEDAVRLDVRQAIANGCFSTLYASLGHPLAVTLRALEVAVDEAAGRLLVGGFTEYATLDENLALVRGAAALGCSHMLVMYPPAMTPSNEDEVFEHLDALVAASDIGVVLYATPHPGMTAFAPSGVPLHVLDRLADRPTVIGLKLTQVIDPVLARICCERFSQRLTINCVAPELMPLLGRDFPLQWSGEWSIEGVQGPSRRLLNDYVALIERRDFTAAEEAYWRFYPAYKLFSDLQTPKLKIGGHPWQHLKYYQWLTGGNGGLISVAGQTVEQIGILTPEDRHAMRAALDAVGVPTVDKSDDDFIVGAENVRRGIPTSAYGQRPLYR